MKPKHVGIQKVVSVLLLVALLLTLATPAFAEGGPTPGKTDPFPEIPKAGDQWIQNLEAKQAYEDAIQKMEPHLYLGADGLLHLDVDSGEAIGVPAAIFQELSAGLSMANAQIRAGDLKVEDIALSNGMNMLGQKAPIYTVSPETMSALGVSCAGWTGITYTWWGPRLYIDECVTNHVVHLLNIGAATGAAWTAAAAADWVPGDETLLAFGSALAWLGSAVIDYIDDIGGNRGVYFQLWWGGGIIWVWHQ